MRNKGKINLVSIGPGALAHMTLRARAAILEAEVVIGYATYIKLVRDLLVGKEVIRKGMTEELDRCVEAYAHARQGKTVALVSSGDIGVYGMAGPTYEVLLQSGWTPDSDIAVEIIPGTTALSACAALVGAPLTHDFCSISLSDLLTPWPVIARRLEAAARGDFVIALYNPKSGRRTGQLVAAQRIILRHRAPETPVAIVKSAYREAQHVQMARLDALIEHPIGMLTTVLIGNSATYLRDGLMITPRGYANKYDSGTVRDGEQAGRSLSIGLDGWQARILDALREPAVRSPYEVARRLATSIGAIVESITSDRSAAAPIEAVALPRTEGTAVLEVFAKVGQVCLRFGSEAANATFVLEAPRFEMNGASVTIDQGGVQWDCAGATTTIALIRRGTGWCGAYLLDRSGNALCGIELEAPNAASARQLDGLWQRYATEPVLALSVH